MEYAFDHIVRNVWKLADTNPELCSQLRKYCYEIIGCCQQVHREMGPWLNEYMYQEALEICLKEHGYNKENIKKEYYFSVEYHGQRIKHKHYVDFFINDKVFIECKAIESLGKEQRQQLWNYMRLTGVRIGILYNFAPVMDQCERYYYDPEQQKIFAF